MWRRDVLLAHAAFVQQSALAGGYCFLRGAGSVYDEVLRDDLIHLPMDTTMPERVDCLLALGCNKHPCTWISLLLVWSEGRVALQVVGIAATSNQSLPCQPLTLHGVLTNNFAKVMSAWLAGCCHGNCKALLLALART